MSAQSIILTLRQLVDLHRELNRMASDKTEVIKAGEVKQLSSLLVQERKIVRTIENLDKDRQDKVYAFLEDKGVLDRNGLLSECIQYASLEEQAILTKLGDELRSEIMSLKERNELNQQLIYQSLQFVNLNLNLMVPEMESYTYERPEDPKERSKQSQSLFDSKA